MKKKTKRAAVSSAAAVITAAGVLVAGAVDAPGELVRDDKPVRVSGPVGVTDMDLPDDPAEEDAGEEKRGSGFKAAVKKRLLSMPLAVRILIVLPLWLLGSAVIAGAGALWPAAAPLLQRFLYILAFAAAVFTLFAVSAKVFFPGLPLKKLVNRRTVPVLLGVSALMCAADLILPSVWDGYEKIRSIAAAALLGAGAFSALLGAGVRRRKKVVPAAGTKITVPSGQSYTVHFPEDE